MKSLIVTADDFGLTDRVNAAIDKAHREGVVTAASLIVTGSGFESAVDIVRCRQQLDVGLHLNLTEGRPIAPPSKISSLAGPNGFHYTHPTKLAIALSIGRVRGGDLECEIRAQLDRATSAGVSLSHIDGHKHVHAIPQILKRIGRIAPEYGIHAARGVNERVPQLSSLLAKNPGASPQIAAQYGFGKVLSAAWWVCRAGGSFNLMTPRCFYGVTQTGFLDLQALEAVFDDLRDGFSELMCHPGYVDEHLKQTPTRLHFQREHELQLLTSNQTRDLLISRNVRLATYRDVLASKGAERQQNVASRVSPGF